MFEKGWREGFFGEFCFEPCLNSCHEVAPSQPVCGKGQAALRLVGGTQAAKAPKLVREKGILVALAPPMVPEFAQIRGWGRGGHVGGKKVASA